MTHPTPPREGDELLEAVGEALSALHERSHHRRPATVKTQLVDDELLACVMGGVYTEVEKTMIGIQRQTVVHQTRNELQTAM